MPRDPCSATHREPPADGEYRPCIWRRERASKRAIGVALGRYNGVGLAPRVPLPSTAQVTNLLVAWGQGDEAAFQRLIPVVHAELRRIARRHMGHERDGHTLQPTALVNEAYLKLIDIRCVQWQDRAHFFAMSSRVMRRVLVDAARARGYQKRGGGACQVTLNEERVGAKEPAADVVALDAALTALAVIDERKSQVVEMRYFGGLSIEETAEALHVSVRTVKRDWTMAKLWLVRELRKTGIRDGD